MPPQDTQPDNPPQQLHPYLRRLVDGETLSESDAEAAFLAVLSGNADPAQIAALLALIQSRGVTPDELTGAARVMRRFVTPVHVDQPLRDRLVDTCGTGGAPKAFNVSTAAAFIAAGVGLQRRDQLGPAVLVAKHGNRSRTGRGSAEVLQQLGVNLDADAQRQARALREAAVCFCFAVRHHPAMKHAAGPRKSLGFPTLFNLLGPLTNPADAQRQLIGVYHPAFLPLVAETLRRLGAARATVAHGLDGLDELTTTAPTQLAEVVAAPHGSTTVRTRTIDAERLGLPRTTIERIRVESPQQSAALIQRLLTPDDRDRHDAATSAAPLDEQTVAAARDIALFNAAAAIIVADAEPDFPQALDAARHAIDSGAALDALHTLRRITNDA